MALVVVPPPMGREAVRCATAIGNWPQSISKQAHRRRQTGPMSFRGQSGHAGDYGGKPALGGKADTEQL
jgi:hypothetical protein